MNKRIFLQFVLFIDLHLYANKLINWSEFGGGYWKGDVNLEIIKSNVLNYLHTRS